jgi:hypothetical protein
MDEYIYFISFVGLFSAGGCTYGNCVLKFPKPISSLQDIQATEAYIKTAPKNLFPLINVCIINLQPLGRVLASEKMILN